MRKEEVAAAEPSRCEVETEDAIAGPPLGCPGGAAGPISSSVSGDGFCKYLEISQEGGQGTRPFDSCVTPASALSVRMSSNGVGVGALKQSRSFQNNPGGAQASVLLKTPRRF